MKKKDVLFLFCGSTLLRCVSFDQQQNLIPVLGGFKQPHALHRGQCLSVSGKNSADFPQGDIGKQGGSGDIFFGGNIIPKPFQRLQQIRSALRRAGSCPGAFSARIQPYSLITASPVAHRRLNSASGVR